MHPVHVSAETIPSINLDHGHIPVGVAAIQLLSTKYDFRYGVTLYSNPANTVNIWIGRAGVTADTNAVTGGFPIVPGASITIPISEMVNLYAISTVAAQDLAWIGV